MADRAPRPPLRESLRAWGLILLLIAGLALALIAIWAFKSHAGAPPSKAAALVSAKGK